MYNKINITNILNTEREKEKKQNVVIIKPGKQLQQLLGFSLVLKEIFYALQPLSHPLSLSCPAKPVVMATPYSLSAVLVTMNARITEYESRI